MVLLDLVPSSQVQQNLFDAADRDKMDALMIALDRVNADFGTGSLRFAAEGLKPRWRMKQNHRSNRYTTRWDELAIVRA